MPWPPLSSIPVSYTHLDVYKRQELLTYISENRDLIGALIGPGGDQAFIKKVIDMSCSEVSDRMQTGILPAAVGAFFDYYLCLLYTSHPAFGGCDRPVRGPYGRAIARRGEPRRRGGC